MGSAHHWDEKAYTPPDKKKIRIRKATSFSMKRNTEA